MMQRYVSSPRTCRRCGLCEAACPVGAVSGSRRGFAFMGEACTECGLCAVVCPALEVRRNELLPADLLTDAHDGPLGPVAETRVGRMAAGPLPESVASGGAVTALLSALMEAGEIDAVAAVAMDPGRPARTATRIVTRTEEITELAGSRYQIASHGFIIPDLEKHGKRIAYVGLPCHIQALRRYEAAGRPTNVALAVGVFCGFNLLPEATDFLLKKTRRRGEKEVKVEYRGGPWPGGFRVRWSSGRQSFIPKNDYALCDVLYLPEFCSYCVDLGAELADISFGDAWYQPGGWTTILVRTATGRKALERAVAAGGLETKEAPLAEVERTQAHIIAHKKKACAARVVEMNVCQENVVDISHVKVLLV